MAKPRLRLPSLRRNKHQTLFRQHAALPFLLFCDGRIEIALVTSRETGRWVIPKGWPKRALTASALAAREAREEAGLVGHIADEPLGTFTYAKRLHVLSSVDCIVDVFLMLVTAQRRRWREQGQRTLAWVNPEEAAERVDEPELKALLLQLPNRLDALRQVGSGHSARRSG